MKRLSLSGLVAVLLVAVTASAAILLVAGGGLQAFVLDFEPPLAAPEACTGTRYNETVQGSDGDDVLEGSDGDDLILAGNGDDTVRGMARGCTGALPIALRLWNAGLHRTVSHGHLHHA